MNNTATAALTTPAANSGHRDGTPFPRRQQARLITWIGPIRRRRTDDDDDPPPTAAALAVAPPFARLAA